ncbi:fimbria/pilus outer membrane usher protein [Enterobacter mori]|uniref:fimbria/pilus outer membrane usher protein n=1 Tax=Enterobacter mori TaxID=539813 RepID=UPI001B8B0992|nr:fimbria/pilus outer membrane usher protein [Enterobacter mori]MBS3046404.1 fimbria/pilus outer membrane usher protein [Enterobacter mori]
MHLMEKLPQRCYSIALITGALVCGHARAENTSPTPAENAASVDPDVLRARGLDPALANYFQAAARFMPGQQRISISVNGIPKGSVNALFNAQGELCFTDELLQQAGLVRPKSWQQQSKGATTAEAQCRDYRTEFPQTQIELNPGNAAVELTVPDEAQVLAQQNYSDYSTGGIAGMLNYQASGLSSQSQGQNSRSMDVDTTAGFNAGDWIVRSRQSYSSRNGLATWSHYSAYAQKTLVEQAMILQAGQVNPNSSLFGIGSLYGIQLFPEQALGVTEGTQVMVSGIAGSQSQVEVRQMGRVIYATVVPPGPFSFNRLPLISDKADLLVSVIESSGATSRFTVPASSFISLGAPQGLSMAAGQLQNVTHGEQPWVVTATNGWRVAPRFLLAAGGLSTQDYHSIGIGTETQAFSWLRLTNQTLLTNDARSDQKGASLQGNASVQLTDRLSAGLGLSYQTLGYRDLMDDITDDLAEQARTHYQSSATLSWSNDIIGGMSAGYFLSTQHNGRQNRRLSGSWGRSIGRASLSLNFDRDVGGTPKGDSRVYVSLSLPLGRSSHLTSFMSSNNGSQRYGSTLSQRLGDMASYSLSAQQGEGDSQNYNANLSMIPRYTQLGLGYGRYGSNSSSYSYSANGSVAIHRHGVTLSPYSIQDTFGIAHVGNLSGIQISTPQGPAWSDPWGNVVISTLPEFRPSRVEIATQSLPRNVDVKNGTQEISAGHGSVNYFQFEVVRVQRLLLKVRLANGETPPKGSPVINEEGSFITIVGDDGAVFFNNENPDEKLYIGLGGDQRCRLVYSLPETDESHYHENVDAVCK